jgi:hypothetical protein
MDSLPPWLKIENLIHSLNISGWFKGWFKRESNNYVQTQINVGSIGIYQSPIIEPRPLKEEQENLCQRLDEWYERYDLKIKPSDMYKGALFAMRPECRNNPDWMAQSAHSLRDILYPFGDNNVPKKEEALKEYGSVRATEVFTQEVGRIFGTLTELSHHGNGRGNSINLETFLETDFEQIVSDFERIMTDALTRQIDVHAEIDDILNIDPE